MSKTAIMTDTNSGITADQAEKLGIYLIPMPVMINDKTYFEGVDLTSEELYRMMNEGAEPMTSQPAIGVLTDMWDKILETHDDLVYIPMSSGLSGSYAAAKALSSDYDGRVEVADAHRISATMKHCVFDALTLAEEGRTAAEILKILEENAFESVIYLGVDTLKYLKKSGRVTASAAAIATILNIKPILIIKGGKLDSFAKVRGLKACKEKIIEAGMNELNGRFSGIPKQNLRVATAGTFENREDAEKWREEVQSAFPDFDVHYDPLSCSIACHTGSGAVGIAITKVLQNIG